MNRTLIALLSLGLVAAMPAASAYAQSSQREDDARRKQEAEAEAKKKQKEKDWATGYAPLPKSTAAGPCPFTRVLYDAGRYVELKDRKEATNAVGFTGEIEGVQSQCAYQSDQPITVKMKIGFGLGKGPAAEGDHKVYRYFVAVTLRNSMVVAKEYFDLDARFPQGEDRIFKVEELDGITIPRADSKINGANFEILVGFDVTPDMADFNRQGKRFRMIATDAPKPQ
jgi:hypothetical protein